MLLRRHERQHQQMKRLHYEDDTPARVLEARDPGLGLTINIALPLLPTLGITLGGSKTTSTTAPANSPAPTTTPATATTTSSSNNGGSNNGGSNNGNGNGGTNNGGTNNGNGDSNNGGSNNGNGNGDSSSSGGSTTANAPASSATTPASGGSDTPSTDGQTPGSSSSGASSTSTPHNLAGSPGFPNQGGSDNGDSTEGSSSGGSSGSSNGGVTGVVNAGVIPGSTSSVSGSRALVSQTNGGTIAAPTSTNTSDNTGDKEHGGTVNGSSTKTAGIAIGIILALLFLLGLILLLRRHRRAQRNQQLNKWWFSRKRTSQSYNDDKLMVQTPPCPPSNRSSFATNVDHSNSFEVNFNTPLPTMPPTAELRMSRNDLQYPAAATTDSGHPVDPRFSLGSVNSSDSHYLFVSHRPSFETNDLNHIGSINALTPMEERFAFPKPPSDASSEISNRISGTEETTKTFMTPNTSPTPPEHQNLPPLVNPFADTAAPMSTVTHTTDPFSDSTVSTSHAHGTAESDSVNPPVPVMRPFASRLPDEVTLLVGDQVKVHQIFDDGWALVDKLEDGVAAQRGLVPIACLR